MALPGSALTVDYVRSILDPAAEDNWEPFITAIDPDVQWTIGSKTYNYTEKTGVYNLQRWVEDVNKPVFSRLKGQSVKMTIIDVDVIGQKAIVECTGEATQLNGRPYNNRYAWFLIFSKETGKIVEIREYLHTALVKELMETNN